MRGYEIGTFLLRLILGITFFVHGLSKFQGGIENTVGFFSSVGIPGVMAYIVAIIELVGGAAMILGFATRTVAVLFVIIMLGAIFTVKIGSGFMGGYELDVVLLVIALHHVFTGSGAFALDRSLKKDEYYSA
ncbi:DoxX family protein [Priestia megaterium]|nr:DoxX family protein [Priestia megaterium]